MIVTIIKSCIYIKHDVELSARRLEADFFSVFRCNLYIGCDGPSKTYKNNI